MTPLQRSFFRRHPADVAPDLLGKLLVRQIGDEIISGRIVETEAYCSTDPASHTYRGKTERNRAMFGEVGHAYIYFIHGLHYCINVTARGDTPAGGVLIRALEPVAGVEFMQQRRKRTALADLASGPAKLTQALAIDKGLYEADMTKQGPLYLAAPAETQSVVVEVTPRIGISRAVDVPWRFVESGSGFLWK
jgi:DNA-3-methyladenine glycosylase